MTDLQKQIDEKWKLVEGKRIEYEKAKSDQAEAYRNYSELRDRINQEIKDLKIEDARSRYSGYFGKYFITDEDYSWIILGKITNICGYNPEEFVYSGYRLEYKQKVSNQSDKLNIAFFTSRTILISDVTYNKKARIIEKEEIERILREYLDHYQASIKEF